jgi:hypothetical protein
MDTQAYHALGSKAGMSSASKSKPAEKWRKGRWSAGEVICRRFNGTEPVFKPGPPRITGASQGALLPHHTPVGPAQGLEEPGTKRGRLGAPALRVPAAAFTDGANYRSAPYPAAVAGELPPPRGPRAIARADLPCPARGPQL